MRVLIAEFATAENLEELIYEGFAMLHTLVTSFERIGCTTFYFTRNVLMNCGTPIFIEDFRKSLRKFSKEVDATLLIAPDILLSELTEEISSENLGSSPEAVRICADKLRCYEILEKEGIRTPMSISSDRYVVKPRFGCGCENTFISSHPVESEELISTPFVKGVHRSVSVVRRDRSILLSVNEQSIVFEDGRLRYEGNRSPSEFNKELIDIALRCGEIFELHGYYGVDFVLGEEPVVVDVNPRITTSIFSISRILKEEISEFILGKRKFPTLTGVHEFRVSDLKKFYEKNAKVV